MRTVFIGLAFVLGVAAPAAARMSCQDDPSDCAAKGLAYELTVPVRSYCDDKHPCVALINLSGTTQVTGFAIAEAPKGHGKTYWSQNLLYGGFVLPPKRWTYWVKPTDLSCNILAKVQLRDRGKMVETPPQSFNLCRKDAAGRAMVKELCVHYPPVDVPPDDQGCRVDQDKQARRDEEAQSAPAAP